MNDEMVNDESRFLKKGCKYNEFNLYISLLAFEFA